MRASKSSCCTSLITDNVLSSSYDYTGRMSEQPPAHYSMTNPSRRTQHCCASVCYSDLSGEIHGMPRFDRIILCHRGKNTRGP